MRLTYKTFDARGTHRADVIDQETDQIVGIVYSQKGIGGLRTIAVSLFDGRYQGRFNRSDQCWGFIKGVECALNHVNEALGMNEAEVHKSAAA